MKAPIVMPLAYVLMIVGLSLWGVYCVLWVPA